MLETALDGLAIVFGWPADRITMSAMWLNPNTSPLELLGVLVGMLCLLTAMLNYHDAVTDSWRIRREGINGGVAAAARDERQAEMFRVVGATLIILIGLIAALTPPSNVAATNMVVGARALYLLLLATVWGSSIRARWNRKRAIAKSLHEHRLEHAAAIAVGRRPSRAADHP